MMYKYLAKGYDELYGAEQEAKLRKVAHLIHGRVLDIGAGTGIVARHFPHVVSLDPTWEMLQKAPGMKVLGRAEYLPFKAKSFDTIISLTALHHAEIPLVIKELQRMQAKTMILSLLKKSKNCKEILQKLQRAFPKAKIIDEEKDLLIVIE